VTCTVGGTTSGYWATGKANTATAPITMVRIAMTLARTGRSMKNFEIMNDPSVRARAGRVSRGCRLRIDFLSRNGPQQTAYNYLIGRRNAFFDHTHRTVELPDLNFALLDNVVLADDQQITAALVGAERGIGNKQCVRLLPQRNLHAHKIA